MNLKAIGRWFIRRDSEAGGTRMAGWIDRASIVISPIIGVSNGILTQSLLTGILSGMASLLLFWVIRGIAGYLDLHVFHVSAYAMDYLTSKMPANVKVLKEKD